MFRWITFRGSHLKTRLNDCDGNETASSERPRSGPYGQGLHSSQIPISLSARDIQKVVS